MAKIAVFNQKGGVGKTTTSLNLTAALARRGYNPLSIDLDPQAHLSYVCGSVVGNADDSVFGFYQNARPLTQLIRPALGGWLVIPAHVELSKVDTQFGKGPNILRWMLDPRALRPKISNWEEVARYLVSTTYAEILADGGEPKALAFIEEIMAYPDVPASFRKLRFEERPTPVLTVDYLVGGKALLATCRNTATVTTIDLSAITRVKANEHRMTVRSRLHRSRGGTRQPKPFAGRIKPSWEKSSPEMELSMNNRGC